MKTLIVIPTYNEIDNIPKIIGRLMNLHPDIHVLVVDDNSPDGTDIWVERYARTQSRVHLLKRAKKNGLGPAYIAGFKWGLERDYEIFFEMDADLSHRPRYLPKFMETIHDADLVAGSRWIPGGRIANWPISRVLLSRLANIYCRVVLGVPIYDLTGGFVCYRREVLERLDLNKVRSDGYSFQVEMKYRAALNGFRISEIPITFTDRRIGHSKISRKIVLEALWMVWFLKFYARPSGKPAPSRLKPVAVGSRES